MSLHPQDPPSIPEETCRVAHAAFPKGTPYLLIADALGAIYKDSQFAALFLAAAKNGITGRYPASWRQSRKR